MPKPPKKTPKTPTTSSEQCLVYLPPNVAAKIDAARGDETRAAWLLSVAMKTLRIKAVPRKKGMQPIDQATLKKIAAKRAAGMSKKDIGAELKIHPQTVAKYLKSLEKTDSE